MLWHNIILLIGIQLLILSHVSHTFILLTANVEDIKKIARKIFSDKLAEDVAEFIVKAGKSLKLEGLADVNVSQENDAYENHIPQSPARNGQQNLKRGWTGNKMTSSTTRFVYERTTGKTGPQQKNVMRENKLKKFSKVSADARYKKEINKESRERHPKLANFKKTKNIVSTTGYIERIFNDDYGPVNLKRDKQAVNVETERTTKSKNVITNDIDDYDYFKSDTKKRPVYKYIPKSKDVTKYPLEELAATSGDVLLPKIGVQTKWRDRQENAMDYK